jgi:tetratricopeptide (TPR) repeat protein
LVAWIAIACAGGTKPATTAPAPLDPGAVPALFDLSKVPKRPELIVGHYGRRVQHDTSATARIGVGSILDSAFVSAVDSPIPVDTNDARLYYAAGIAAARLHVDPTDASAAFYWASRIDPSWAEPYFARWYVLRVAAEQRVRVRPGAPRPAPLPHAVLLSIDSLILVAYARNPFLDDGLVMHDLSRNAINRIATARNAHRAVVERENDYRMREGEAPLLETWTTTPAPRAWYIAYGARQFDSASSQLAPLIKKNPDNIGLYVYRAKALFFMRQYDSAANVLRVAVDRITHMDSVKTLPIYISKEQLVYSIGMAYQFAREDSAARETYQQTVTENLGSYMGHLHLANSALAVRDTATAITEGRMAAEIRPDDPVVQLFLGYTLLQARQDADAATQLGLAVRADSSYALPYMYLGEAYMMQHDTANAIAALRGYIARSRADQTEFREGAQAAITALGGIP